MEEKISLTTFFKTYSKKDTWDWISGWISKLILYWLIPKRQLHKKTQEHNGERRIYGLSHLSEPSYQSWPLTTSLNLQKNEPVVVTTLNN